MVELSPLDILAKSFDQKWRGYDQQQVHEFLSQVAARLEELLRERGEMKQQLVKVEQDMAQFKERESALQDALIAAQKSAEHTLEGAREDAQRIIDDGHTLANSLVEDAHARARKIELVISDLRSRRREARSELRRLVEMLDGYAADDEQLEKETITTPQVALLHRSQSSNEGQT
ncbi:MAG: DivIVA domain-containing protein [bacterium]|nr:DivIVA domain-containing protein [bacterium]